MASPPESLPPEIILHIHQLLDSWEDRLNFAETSETIWKKSVKLRSDDVLELSMTVNPLQLATSRHIKLPEQELPIAFLEKAIKDSHALEELIIPKTSSSKSKFAKWLIWCICINHAKADTIMITVPAAHRSIWHTKRDALARKYDAVPSFQTPSPTLPVKRPAPADQDPDVDKYETPEEVNRHKGFMKRLCIRVGEARLRASQSASEVVNPPLPTSRLLERGVRYQADYLDAYKHEGLSPANTLTSTAANDLVKELAERYIEAVVIFDNYWFFITGIDLFLHRRPTIDDCADNSSIPFKQHAEAAIRVKSNSGWDYYELTIRVGDLELLAVGGFHGDDLNDSRHPFLGSSVSNLPQELKQPKVATDILIRSRCGKLCSSNRLLRQYGKSSANLAWSFHSLRFYLRAFYPFNPVAYADHRSALTSRSEHTHRLASFVVSCLAHRTARKGDCERLLVQLRLVKAFEHYFKQDTTTFAALRKNMEGVKNDYLMTVVDSIVLLEGYAQENNQEINLLPYLTELRNRSLQIVNKGYARALKSANESAAKAYHP
ncbi:hypothetical protein VTP01DRAFT_7284 [Rhizomucor pusillus]|uniref:uncharacterized protein n=1 Tax=Rhizomucor pusillus TaxID=4840 RepID=UPI00374219B6